MFRSFKLFTFCIAGILTYSACSRSPQARETQFLEGGKKLAANKDYGRAILQFKNAAQVRPKDAEPYYQLGRAYLEMGETATAIQCFLKATRMNPAHVDARIRLAELKTSSGDPKLFADAQASMQSVLAAQPENTDAATALAVAEMRLGKPQNAIDDLERVLARSPQELKAAMLLANIKLNAKDMPAARKVLEDSAAKTPNSPEAAVALSRIYRIGGQNDASEHECLRALKLNPRYGPALLDLMRLRFSQGNTAEGERVLQKISLLPDREMRPLFGAYLAQKGDSARAVDEFARLYQLDPNDRAARSRLISAYLAAHRNSEAEGILTKVLKQNSKDVDALLQRAVLSISFNKLQEAENDVNQAQRFQPDSGDVHFLRAQIARLRGQQLNQRQELGEAVRLNPRLLEARAELCRLLIQEKSARAALELIDGAPADQKQLPSALLTRNWALLATGDLAGLKTGLEDTARRGSSRDLLLQNAFLHMAQRDPAGARPFLDRALKANPEDVQALDALTRTYLAQNQPAAAVAKAREYAAARPKSALLQEKLGDLLLQTGDAAGSRDAYVRARQADPKLLDAQLALTELNVKEGKLAEARSDLKGMLASSPQSPKTRLWLAYVEHQAGNYPEAISLYRQVIQADPSNVVALNNLAYLLANDSHQPDEALLLAQRVKELAPQDSSVEDTIGWAYFQKGIYRTALTHLENAARTHDNPAVRYHLGLAYLRAGDEARGRQTLSGLLRNSPQAAEARLAKNALDGNGASARSQ